MFTTEGEESEKPLTVAELILELIRACNGNIDSCTVTVFGDELDEYQVVAVDEFKVERGDSPDSDRVTSVLLMTACQNTSTVR